MVFQNNAYVISYPILALKLHMSNVKSTTLSKDKTQLFCNLITNLLELI